MLSAEEMDLLVIYILHLNYEVTNSRYLLLSHAHALTVVECWLGGWVDAAYKNLSDEVPVKWSEVQMIYI